MKLINSKLMFQDGKGNRLLILIWYTLNVSFLVKKLRGRLVIQFKHTHLVFKHWTYVSKKRKTYLVIHFQHRLFGKHCSKTGFQTHSFEITSGLFLNNKIKVLSGNWVIILKMVRAHLVRYVSSLPLTIIPKFLQIESQSPPG